MRQARWLLDSRLCAYGGGDACRCNFRLAAPQTRCGDIVLKSSVLVEKSPRAHCVHHCGNDGRQDRAAASTADDIAQNAAKGAARSRISASRATEKTAENDPPATPPTAPLMIFGNWLIAPCWNAAPIAGPPRIPAITCTMAGTSVSVTLPSNNRSGDPDFQAD